MPDQSQPKEYVRVTVPKKRRDCYDLGDSVEKFDYRRDKDSHKCEPEGKREKVIIRMWVKTDGPSRAG